MAAAMQFQSTLPARGATYALHPDTPSHRISIHAPRTGSDAQGVEQVNHLVISIHAPRTGSDEISLMILFLDFTISIHAPRTGSDDDVPF